MKTYGLDYSFSGLLDSVKGENHLVCSDLFTPPFVEESFDLVFSLGVIEHFSNPKSVIARHLDLLKINGLLLITVPNFYEYSLLTTVIRLIGKYQKIRETHNMSLMNRDEFKGLFKSFPLRPILNDWYGPFGVLSPAHPFLRRLCMRVNKSLDRFAVKSKVFSPDMVFIGQKLQ